MSCMHDRRLAEDVVLYRDKRTFLLVPMSRINKYTLYVWIKSLNYPFSPQKCRPPQSIRRSPYLSTTRDISDSLLRYLHFHHYNITRCREEIDKRRREVSTFPLSYSTISNTQSRNHGPILKNFVLDRLTNISQICATRSTPKNTNISTNKQVTMTTNAPSPLAIA